MTGSNSIINVGDFAKPANTLIEKISDAIGGIARPYQIVRVAQAEAEAEKIRAVTQIEVTELQRRSVQRFIMEEAKKQNNIETITSKALTEIASNARPEQVEDDWITHFFGKCRLISDEEMQDLWARILAGEANVPGTFSKRTVDVVASLDKSDALLFSKLCCFGVQADEFRPLVYGAIDPIYTGNGINFEGISHLESIGLIQTAAIGGYQIGCELQKVSVRYFDQELWVELRADKNFHLGVVSLTRVGRQLAPLGKPHAVDGFIDYLHQRWRFFGYKSGPTDLREQADANRGL